MHPTNLSTYFARLLLIWFELLSDNGKVYFMSSQPYSQNKKIIISLPGSLLLFKCKQQYFPANKHLLKVMNRNIKKGVKYIQSYQ